MTGSGGQLHTFYNDIRAPATNRTMAAALLSLEISQMQVSEVEIAVRGFLEGVSCLARLKHVGIQLATTGSKKW